MPYVPCEVQMVVRVTKSDLKSASLTCDANFNWSDERDSEIRYLYRVKFKKAGRVVAVDLSLSHKSARVVKDGSVVASASFEFGYEVVVGVIERYFPIHQSG
jgi:hypothetical protein